MVSHVFLLLECSILCYTIPTPSSEQFSLSFTCLLLQVFSRLMFALQFRLCAPPANTIKHNEKHAGRLCNLSSTLWAIWGQTCLFQLFLLSNTPSSPSIHSHSSQKINLIIGQTWPVVAVKVSSKVLAENLYHLIPSALYHKSYHQFLESTPLFSHQKLHVAL